MPENDEPDESAGRQPLPPDDRLWRHPSEMRAAAPAPASSAPSLRPKRPQHGFGLALIGGAVAAVAVVVTLDMTGAMRDRDTTTVEFATVSTSIAVTSLNADRKVVPDITGVAWIDAGDTGAPIVGIVIDDYGHVLTSARSISSLTPSGVQCAGERTQNVRLVGIDREHNTAVLATDMRGWPRATVDTVRLHVGDDVDVLFHDDSRSTPDIIGARVRRVAADGDPVIEWSGNVDRSAIAMSSGGAVVALLDGTTSGDGVGITEALKSAQSIISRSDSTTTTTQG